MKKLIFLILMLMLIPSTIATTVIIPPYNNNSVYTALQNTSIPSIFTSTTGLGAAYSSSSTLLLWSNVTNGQYQQNRRFYALWNTTGVCVPSSAKLRIFPLSKSGNLGTTNYYIGAQNHSILINTSANDYARLVRSDPWITNTVNYADLPTTGYLDLTINDLSKINRTGKSGFVILSSWDKNLTSDAIWASSTQTAWNFNSNVSLIIDCGDSTPSNSITNLVVKEYHNTTSVNISFDLPLDIDYSGVSIYKNNSFMVNVTGSAINYIKSSLTRETTYLFSTKTYDMSGNYNNTWVNYTYTTNKKPISDNEWSFFHTSDLQQLTTVHPELLNQFFINANEIKDDYNLTDILNTGDLTNGNIPTDFTRYATAETYSTLNNYKITGNHDMNNQLDNYTAWDTWIPNGTSQHNYPFILNNKFAVYGFGWNGTTDSIYLNATARNQANNFFNSNDNLIPLILNHKYKEQDCIIQPIGNDIRNLITGDNKPAIVLSGHSYYPVHTWGNCLGINTTNTSQILEDQWNMQDIPGSSHSGGRLFTINDTSITTRDVFFNPYFEINNTQTWYINWSYTPPSIITPISQKNRYCGIQNLFFSDLRNDNTSYGTLLNYANGIFDTDENITVQAGESPKYIDGYLTPIGSPSNVKLLSGLRQYNMYASVSSLAQPSYLTFNVSVKHANGTYTNFYNTTSTAISSLTPTVDKTYYVSTKNQTFLSTDQMLVEIYGYTTRVSPTNIHFYNGGVNTASYLQSGYFECPNIDYVTVYSWRRIA